MRFLVNNDHASSFLTLASTEAGRRAFLGDHEKIGDTQASVAVLNSQIALRDALSTIEALTRDETRSLPQRHEAAARLAERVITQLTEAKETFGSRADALWERGTDEATAFFAPNLSRSFLDAQVIGFVKEQATKPDGILKVGELVRTNKNVAAVVFNTDDFLLGINGDTHSKMKFDAVESHAPNSYVKMTASLALRELPPRYDKAINAVRTSFYSPNEAAKTATRVNI